MVTPVQPELSNLLSAETQTSNPSRMVSIPEGTGFSQPEGHETKLKSWAGGKASLPCRRGSFLDVVIIPAVNKANKFWSGACAPEKGADWTVPSVWSLLASARQIKRGKGKGQGDGGNCKFYMLNSVCSTLKNRDKETGLGISLNCLCWQVRPLQMTYLTQIPGKAPELLSKFCLKPQFY